MTGVSSPEIKKGIKSELKISDLKTGYYLPSNMNNQVNKLFRVDLSEDFVSILLFFYLKFDLIMSYMFKFLLSIKLKKLTRIIKH